jgi:integrase
MAPRLLTDPFIRNLKPAPAGQRYAISDALVPGLRVRVTATGSKTYILWRRVAPTHKSASALALGAVGQLTLAQARDKARAWLAMIAQGQDPRAARQAHADTFAVIFEDYLRRHVRGLRKAKDHEREMRKELLPRWATKPVAAITRRDVISMVDEIKDRGAVYQAHNMLAHAKTFFNWCIEKDILQASPCDRMKATRLIGARKPRQRVLNDDELRALWRAAGRMAYPHGPLFRMLLLTGQRRSECGEAQWPEFDLPNRLWTIPAARFKSNSAHMVPLADAVVALLHGLPRWVGGDYLFTHSGGKHPATVSSQAKASLDARILRTLRALARMRGDNPGKVKLEPFVIHDLRRSMRTRLSSLRIPDVVCEMIIGHGRKGLQRVYDQHTFQDEMREGLEAWAARLHAIVNPPPPRQNVVQLAKVR